MSAGVLSNRVGCNDTDTAIRTAAAAITHALRRYGHDARTAAAAAATPTATASPSVPTCAAARPTTPGMTRTAIGVRKMPVASSAADGSGRSLRASASA